MSDFEKALVGFFKENNQFTVLTVVYKVVRIGEDSNTFYSFAHALKCFNLISVYQKGSTTIPKVGSLFVFKSKHTANMFYSSARFKAAILKGYGKNVRTAPDNVLLLLLYKQCNRSIVTTFWKYVNNRTKCKPKYLAPTPIKSYICDSFFTEEVILRRD